MWAYQRHFRLSLERSAKTSLGSVGTVLAPTACLVGLAEDSETDLNSVESEGSGIGRALFADCLANGQRLYDGHENRAIFNTHPEVHARFHADLIDRCRADAISEVLNAHADADVRLWFVGSSAQVGQFRVYPAIGVLRTRWEALPSLRIREHDHRSQMHLSIQEAVLDECLAAASFALSITPEPEGLLWKDRDELVRRAAKTFMRQLASFKGDFMGADLDTTMNLVAAQPYEGRTGVGTLLLGQTNDYQAHLTFEEPISLGQTRALRKALEMTDTSLYLITNGNDAFGLGTISAEHDPATESAFLLRVTGRGSWELEHDGRPLVTFTDGHPSVPKERIARDSFDDAVTRLFGDAGDGGQLWDLALAAARQAHGTMLVVHEDAHDEAARLSPPAMRVAPASLSEDTLLAVSSIDGAILVDPSGECHAVGVILDGRAAPGLGDASRGARFNSAHRYLSEATSPCLIIIVSEDGMINLIPDLPRRVERSYVESVLTEVEGLSREVPVDFEAFHRREDHLRSLAFYLNPEQCARANEARERVETYRQDSAASSGQVGSMTRVGYQRYKPDERLNNSYFLD